MDRPTCNEQPLDKFTLTICWILCSDYMDKVSWQSWKISRSEIVVWNMHEYDAAVRFFFDRRHCYNKEVV
jgi:hypothetical protein